ncbi:MAG: hypothetical protein IT480_10840 [Gammaproteobacteria bacterium]|nr:hypothetical protein [Gammaproteobacteria bacterium]
MKARRRPEASILNRSIDRRELMRGAGYTLAAATTTTLLGRAAAAADAAALPAPAAPAGSHDRAGLERMIDTYLAALVAHDPSRAPFVREALFADNDQRLPLGDGSWQTIERLGRYRHYFAEPENALAGVIANAVENGQGVILIATLKMQGDEIAWAEQFVLRDPHGARTYEELGQPDPVWFEPIPPAQRQSREALEAAAWIYFQALERNDGAGVYPFRDDCERIEHARRTVRQPKVEGYGHSDTATNFITLTAKEQYQLGLMAFVTRIRDRRAAVVDIERGVVLGQSVWDFDGTLEAIRFRDGRHWQIPPYFRTPRCHQVTEAFKVINGSFRYIEMTLMEVPFGSRQVIAQRAPTVSLTYAATRPPARPVPAGTRAQLHTLTGRVLDGLIRNAPWELPLAPRARYTENGCDVALGEGLWKSLAGLRAYGVFLTDPATAQAGWFGSLDEAGLFAALALRLRTVDGLITEIETLITRPETEAVVKSRSDGGAEVELKGATYTMFVPPLLANVEPQGFARVDPALLASVRATPRAAMLDAVQRYYQAFTGRNGAAAPLAAGCRRRENGIAASDNAEAKAVDPAVPGFRLYGSDCAGELTAGFLARFTRLRGRRTWLVDEAAGLVLDLATLDNPATARSVEIPGYGAVKLPASCLAPWTDLHAAVFRVDAGRISHIETLVRRVPYGQGTGWST